jgi:hypothetical protein
MPDEINPADQAVLVAAYVEDIPTVSYVHPIAIRRFHIIMRRPSRLPDYV